MAASVGREAAGESGDRWQGHDGATRGGAYTVFWSVPGDNGRIEAGRDHGASQKAVLSLAMFRLGDGEVQSGSRPIAVVSSVYGGACSAEYEGSTACMQHSSHACWALGLQRMSASLVLTWAGWLETIFYHA
jgi:hypothetical protein